MLEIRELLQNMVILTRKMHETSDKAWRNETAYRAILLLQTSMAVLDYPSLHVPAWEIQELDPKERAKMKENLDYEFGFQKDSQHTEYDESMRVPVIMAFKLRWCLDTSEDRLSSQMHTIRSLGLYKSIDEFMNAYYALTKLLTTQFPFPLVQMARTFLLFYICEYLASVNE